MNQLGTRVVGTTRLKWIVIVEHEPPKGYKTKTFKVYPKSNPDSLIGTIHWFPSFRKYAYFPSSGTVYDASCLTDLSDFLEKIGREHKS